MLIRDKAIEITKDNIDKIIYDDVVIITAATGPAQGEPNGLMIATKSLDVFHTNRCIYDSPEKAKIWNLTPDQIVPIKELVEKLPLLDSIKTNGLQFFNDSNDWEMVYMNYGNYLFIRKEYAKKFLSLVDKHDGRDRIWWIYAYWYDMLSECLTGKSNHKAPQYDIYNIIMWMQSKKLDNDVVINETFRLIDEDKKRDIYELSVKNKRPKYVIYDKITDTIIYTERIKDLKHFL